MDVFRDAGALASEQQGVAGPEFEAVQRRRAASGEEHEPAVSALRRRNVFRASVLYIGAVWALAQGVAQLAPVFGAPEWGPRWLAIAGVLGFPFWIVFAWFFEFTPEGIKLERDVEPGASITHQTGRKLPAEAQPWFARQK